MPMCAAIPVCVPGQCSSTDRAAELCTRSTVNAPGLKTTLGSSRDGSSDGLVTIGNGPLWGHFHLNETPWET